MKQSEKFSIFHLKAFHGFLSYIILICDFVKSINVLLFNVCESVPRSTVTKSSFCNRHFSKEDTRFQKVKTKMTFLKRQFSLFYIVRQYTIFTVEQQFLQPGRICWTYWHAKYSVLESWKLLTEQQDEEEWSGGREWTGPWTTWNNDIWLTDRRVATLAKDAADKATTILFGHFTKFTKNDNNKVLFKIS